jgi:hypothetical protein
MDLSEKGHLKQGCGSGSRGKKMKKFPWKKHFFNYTGIFDLIQILILKKLKEIVFESSVLAWIRIRNRIRNWIRNWIRIRIEQKCCIRIRIKSIRIHDPDLKE